MRGDGTSILGFHSSSSGSIIFRSPTVRAVERHDMASLLVEDAAMPFPRRRRLFLALSLGRSVVRFPVSMVPDSYTNKRMEVTMLELLDLSITLTPKHRGFDWDLTVKEAAEQLRVSPVFVRCLIAERQITATHLSLKQDKWQIKESELIRFVKAQREYSMSRPSQEGALEAWLADPSL